MANIKSQIKRIKTNEKARLRNKSVKSSLKTAIRKFREAADAGDVGTATTQMQAASRAARQGREQGRHPREPGRQPQVGDGPADRQARGDLSLGLIDRTPDGVDPCGSAPFGVPSRGRRSGARPPGRVSPGGRAGRGLGVRAGRARLLGAGWLVEARGLGGNGGLGDAVLACVGRAGKCSPRRLVG